MGDLKVKLCYNIVVKYSIGTSLRRIKLFTNVLFILLARVYIIMMVSQDFVSVCAQCIHHNFTTLVNILNILLENAN